MKLHKRTHDQQGGFTLIEVLVAMTLSGLILAAVSAALIVVLRTPPQTADHLSSSDSAFRTASTFADDIASATPEGGQVTVARNAPGCGGGNASVVRVLTTHDDEIEIRSYTVVEPGHLERRVCRGAIRADALEAEPVSVRTVVTNLVEDSPPTVTCRANAGAPLAPETLEGDLECRLVSMTVATTGNMVFTVNGRRDTVQSPITSPPVATTSTKCTVGVNADTHVDSWYSNATPYTQEAIRVQAKTGGVRLNAYLKFDLKAGCIGAGEEDYLPNGKTVDKATLRLTLLKKDGANNGPNANDKFRLTTLPEWYFWDEARLKFTDLLGCGITPTNSRPHPLSYPCEYNGSGVRSDPDGIFHNFNVGTGPIPAGGRPVDIDVTATVRSWYSAPGTNQGWTLDRGYYKQNDTDRYGSLVGWAFGSLDSPNSDIRPQLIVEWK